MISIAPAEISHCEDICKNLRQHEIKLADKFGVDPLKLLHWGVENSALARTGFVDEAPACMWGVEQRTLLGTSNLWLVTTNLIDKHPLAFLRESKAFIKRTSGTLYGFVDEDFCVSQRWMEWLGFKVIDKTNQTLRYELRNGH